MTRKTNIVRGTVLTLVVLMALSYLPGRAAADEPLELAIWTLFSGGEGYIMTNLINQFNTEHPAIHLSERPIEWGAYYDELLAGLLTDKGPDIAIMHLSILPTYAEKDVLTPIEGYVSQEFRAQFLGNISQKAAYGQHFYAIPIDIHPYVLYYDKAVLQQAGLVDAAGEVLLPKTWDELLTYGETIKDKTGKWGMTTDSNYVGERWWIALYRQADGLFFDPAAAQLQVEPDKAARAYQVMKAFYTHKVTPFIPDYAECEQLFLQQQSGFHINGVWAMAVYPNAKGRDVGVTSIPSLNGSRAYTWGDSHAFVFPQHNDAEKLRAALTFAQWFSDHSIAWAKAGHLPANKEVLHSPAMQQLPMREDYASVGRQVVLAPSVLGWDEMRRFLWDLAQRVNSNLIPIEKAVDVLQDKVSEINAR
jgi:multiple sugar transport system substrate-binding protein